MRLFQNDVELAEALRVLSETRLIAIVADGKVRFSLSAAIVNARSNAGQ